MKKYLVKTYGCQMNVHESEKIAGILRDIGYTEATDEKDSDIIVFNTCCIRETAEAKISGHIGEVARLKKRNPELIVVVCGCMSQQEGVAASLKKRFPWIDIILGTSNLHLLAEKINGVHQKRELIDVGEYNIVSELPSYRTSGVNAWVNIIYGCNNFCTYCIVPYVRGRERSRKESDIIAEVSELLKAGYKEITLLGQNVNSYGKDLGDGSCFSKLLEKLAVLPYKYRLRFMTSHPKDFSDDVIDIVAKYDNICKSIHLPVQSGSSRVLKSMNRHYTREQYIDMVKRIREKIPNVGLSADIMVGFAGETEEDFLDTLDLVKQVRYSSCFCFVYSRRKGTPGYSMENQVPKPIKTDRIKRLIATQNEVTREISKAFEGKTVEILVDGLNDKYKTPVYCGRTDCGKLVNFKCDHDCTGELVNVKINRSQSATLFGEIID